MELNGGFEKTYDWDLGFNLGFGPAKNYADYPLPWYFAAHLSLIKFMVWFELSGRKQGATPER